MKNNCSYLTLITLTLINLTLKSLTLKTLHLDEFIIVFMLLTFFTGNFEVNASEFLGQAIIRDEK